MRHVCRSIATTTTRSHAETGKIHSKRSRGAPANGTRLSDASAFLPCSAYSYPSCSCRTRIDSRGIGRLSPEQQEAPSSYGCAPLPGPIAPPALVRSGDWARTALIAAIDSRPTQQQREPIVPGAATACRSCPRLRSISRSITCHRITDSGPSPFVIALIAARGWVVDDRSNDFRGRKHYRPAAIPRGIDPSHREPFQDVQQRRPSRDYVWARSVWQLPLGLCSAVEEPLAAGIRPNNRTSAKSYEMMTQMNIVTIRTSE